MASCRVDLPASLGPTTRFMVGPKRRSIPCKAPNPSISIRVRRTSTSPQRSAQASLVKGIERELQRSADRLFLLARPLLVVDQLAHHLPAAGKFLGGGIEVVGHAGLVAELEIRESVATFHRERLRVERQCAVALANQR